MLFLKNKKANDYLEKFKKKTKKELKNLILQSQDILILINIEIVQKHVNWKWNKRFRALMKN